MMTIDHGIEYHVEFDGTFDFYPALSKYIAAHKKQPHWDPAGLIVIANTKATDERLVVSQYYHDSERRWFDITQGKKRIMQTDESFTLTDDERDYLSFVLRELGYAVVYHGWYEVVYYR